MSKGNKKGAGGKASLGVSYTKVATHDTAVASSSSVPVASAADEDDDIHSRASDGCESSMSQGIPLKKQQSGSSAATSSSSSAAAAAAAANHSATAAKKDFVASKGLTSREALDLLAVHGKNELEDKSVPKWLIFLQQLWAPMPIMIWIAAITEAGIQNWPDMGILLAIQFINASLGYYEIIKAGMLHIYTHIHTQHNTTHNAHAYI